MSRKCKQNRGDWRFWFLNPNCAVTVADGQYDTFRPLFYNAHFINICKNFFGKVTITI